MSEIGRRDQILRLRSEVVASSATEEIQPISEMSVAIPDLVRTGARLLVFHPAAHAEVLIFENPFLALAQINLPRNDGGGIAPSCRAVDRAITVAQHIRHNEWNTSAVELIGGEILEPLAEKSVDVHVEWGRGREHLRISGPPQPLIALRTIGRDVEKISLLSPLNIVLQLIDQRFGCRKGPGHGHVRMQRNSRDAVTRQLSRVSAHRDIPEALISEVRFKNFLALAAQRVAHGRSRCTEGVRI